MTKRIFYRNEYFYNLQNSKIRRIPKFFVFSMAQFSDKTRCIVCQKICDHRDQLEIHVAIEHVGYLPYECEHCSGTGARFPSEFSLKTHYLEVHNHFEVFIFEFRGDHYLL